MHRRDLVDGSNADLHRAQARTAAQLSAGARTRSSGSVEGVAARHRGMVLGPWSGHLAAERRTGGRRPAAERQVAIFGQRSAHRSAALRWRVQRTNYSNGKLIWSLAPGHNQRRCDTPCRCRRCLRRDLPASCSCRQSTHQRSSEGVLRAACACRRAGDLGLGDQDLDQH